MKQDITINLSLDSDLSTAEIKRIAIRAIYSEVELDGVGIEEIKVKPRGEMVELGERNYALLKRAVKMTGSYQVEEVFPAIEEDLYIDEIDTIKAFLNWVCEGKEKPMWEGSKLMVSTRGFGSGNYEERFQQFLKETGRPRLA